MLYIFCPALYPVLDKTVSCSRLPCTLKPGPVLHGFFLLSCRSWSVRSRGSAGQLPKLVIYLFIIYFLFNLFIGLENYFLQTPCRPPSPFWASVTRARAPCTASTPPASSWTSRSCPWASRYMRPSPSSSWPPINRDLMAGRSCEEEPCRSNSPLSSGPWQCTTQTNKRSNPGLILPKPDTQEL